MIAATLAVGIPYWSLDYGEITLPMSIPVLSWACTLVAATALAYTRVLPAIVVFGVMCMPAPIAVMIRIIVDVASDPTRHNLWPLELVITGIVAALWSGVGTGAGALAARVDRR